MNAIRARTQIITHSVVDKPLSPELSHQLTQDGGASPRDCDGSTHFQPPLYQKLFAEAGGLPTMCQLWWDNQVIRQDALAAVKEAGPLHTAQQGSGDIKCNTFPPPRHLVLIQDMAVIETTSSEEDTIWQLFDVTGPLPLKICLPPWAVHKGH